MRVLTVFCHPNRQSYTGACMDAFHAGLEDGGHEWEMADLYAEGFDPVFKSVDFAQFTSGPQDMPEEILREQARITRADAVAFVFPVWWWSCPAMLKGWFERVWCCGWAYDFTIERSTGRLGLSKAVMICPGGTAVGTYRRYGYHESMRRTMDAGLMGYCGVDDVEMHIFPAVDDNASARKEYLEVAYKIGQNFSPSDEVITLSSHSRV